MLIFYGLLAATLAITICEDRHKLKPYLVFKGKSGGRIEHDFSSYWVGCHYGVQEKTWIVIGTLLD